jgi:hypothetical protein
LRKSIWKRKHFIGKDILVRIINVNMSLNYKLSSFYKNFAKARHGGTHQSILAFRSLRWEDREFKACWVT